MSKVQMLRSVVKQRLTAAAEEIFGLFERTIAEYEEELSSSKEENERQRKLLDAVFNPEVRKQRADVQQLLMGKEVVPPEQQDWSSSLDQEDPEPPHIKEEQEELWTSQEGEQLQGLEEADTKFSFTPVKSEDDEEDCGGPEPDVQQLLVVKEVVPPEQQDWSSRLDQEDPEPPYIKEEQEELWTSQEGEQLQGLEEADTKFSFTTVKSEDDEEEAQSSQLHQRQTEENSEVDHLKTEADGEEVRSRSDPDSPLRPAADETSQSSECETDDSRDWKETQEPQSDLNPLQNNEVPVSDVNYNTGNTSISSSECAGSFGHKRPLKRHSGIQTGVKPFHCSVCGKRFVFHSALKKHFIFHTGEKQFMCPVCGKKFTLNQHLRRHMTVHTGEKPFSCSVCGKTFAQQSVLKRHMTVHSGEKLFSCPVCGRTFAREHYLKGHLTVHTGEKPFSCSVCSKTFSREQNLKRHLIVHTGEKPFSCSVCGKRFSQQSVLKRHMTVHSREKPFSCSVCSKTFSQQSVLKRHMTVHTGETN